MTIETKPDLIEEVEALLANPKVFARSWYEGKQARDLLRRLVDENKRLRQFGCEHCDCTCGNCGPCGEKLP